MPDEKTYNGLIAVTYQPSGNKIGYIPPLKGNTIWQPTDDEIEILQSKGKTGTYPGEWCDSLMFAGYVTEIHSEIYISPDPSLGGAIEYVSPWSNPIESTYKYMLLEAPLNKAWAYSGATHFIGGEEFGQDAVSTVPSQVKIKPVVGGTEIEWYYNGVLLHTDTIAGHNVSEFMIAVKINGFTTASDYAIIWYENGIPWSSGARGNADVLQKIINNAGEEQLSQSVTGWQDPDDPDKQFILTHFEPRAGDWLAGGRTGETVTTALEDLVTRTNGNGGLIGTDLVTYITNIPDSAGAWDYLMNDPESDMLTFNIPSAEGHAYRIEWHYDRKNFYVYDDTTQTTYSYSLSYRQGGVVILIGTKPGETALGWSMLIRTSGAIVVPQYDFYYLNANLNDTETEEFDYNDAFFEEMNGYDSENEGEPDNPQPDADDMEDPTIDALSTGFVYAFDVTSTDMENLISCLNGNTLQQQIKNTFGNRLFDFIVSYHTMPCITNATEGSRIGINYMGVPFIYGEGGTQLTLKQITRSWYSVDCGTKLCYPTGSIRPNGFENWSQAKVQMYLPFIGTVHLNTADVWNRNVHVVYYFDVLTGSCSANIGVDGLGTIYSYEGSCCYKIPFTSVIDQSLQNTIAGITQVSQGVVTATMGAISGNYGAIAGGIMQGAGSIGNFISANEHQAIVNRGGSLGGSGGWHTPRSPALIITVPNKVTKFNDASYFTINGYPTHRAVTLNGYKGQYVEVGSIDLKSAVNDKGATPNDSELDMIRSALLGGVYV